jgi:putative redox protein
MRALGTWQGGYRTVLEDSSGHQLTVDLPTDEGGKNTGPFALELSVMALAGCITTIFAIVAKKRRLSFEGMTVDLTADRPAGTPTIVSVTGVARVTSDAPTEEIETALDVTLKTCPVGVLFERAKIPVHVRVEVVDPGPIGIEFPGARAPLSAA